MISRAFPDFVHGQISNIYRVGENCVVKRIDGTEQRYEAEKIKAKNVYIILFILISL